MKGLNPNLKLETQKTENRPVELYQLFLDSGTYYYAAHDEDVQFFDEQNQPRIYEALGITRSPIRTNIDNRVDECTISLNNVSRQGTQLVANTDLVNKRARIIKVFLDLLYNPADHILIFDGQTDEPVVTQDALRLTIKSRLDILNIQTPRRRYTRLCSWRFGGDECTKNLNQLTVTGTAGTITNMRIVKVNGRNDPVNHWAGGILTATTPNKPIEKRIIVANSNNEIEVDLPFKHIAPGAALTIRRGCGRTFSDDCKTKYNNEANFGGFIAVPLKRDDLLRKPWSREIVETAATGKKGGSGGGKK